ncbi:MAG: hypothetical protein IPM88_14335 [Nitrospira sp.]|nr:hypothetical protein [Nitrospira sp.]
MARPISRTFFILGKYLGLALTLFVNMAIMMAVFLATLWLYHVPIERSLFQAVELIFVEILVVTAIALFFDIHLHNIERHLTLGSMSSGI